jgi:hypothetical protein
MSIGKMVGFFTVRAYWFINNTLYKISNICSFFIYKTDILLPLLKLSLNKMKSRTSEWKVGQVIF